MCIPTVICNPSASLIVDTMLGTHLVRFGRIEIQQLCDDQVCHIVVHRAAQSDDALHIRPHAKQKFVIPRYNESVGENGCLEYLLKHLTARQHTTTKLCVEPENNSCTCIASVIAGHLYISQYVALQCNKNIFSIPVVTNYVSNPSK